MHEELWASYQVNRSLELKNKLALEYDSLVKHIAKKVKQGLPNSIEMDDLMSYGYLGLLDAIEKFDQGLGYKFETYATSRVRGAMLDGLRGEDWVPRSVRAKDREEGTQTILYALDEPMGSDGEENITLADGLHADDWDLDLIDGLAMRLADAADSLSDREKIVLVLYYYNGLTLAEIGTILGVTESRVSQIQTKATSDLKASL